jgi:serine/threonine protein kinase
MIVFLIEGKKAVGPPADAQQRHRHRYRYRCRCRCRHRYRSVATRKKSNKTCVNKTISYGLIEKVTDEARSTHGTSAYSRLMATREPGPGSSADPIREPEAKPLFGDQFTDVSQDYVLGRKLGSGNFAKVVHAEVRRTQPQWKLKGGDGVAIKVVKKPSSRRSVERVQMLKAEVQILRSINHPNIVKLYDVYESPSRLYLVMELLTGGELFDRIVVSAWRRGALS